MANTLTSKAKINIIRRLVIAGPVNKYQLAKDLQISKNTVYRHVQDFIEMERQYPGRIHDEGFFMPRKKFVMPPSARQLEMIEVFPLLMDRIKTPYLRNAHVWEIYRSLYPNGLKYGSFHKYFTLWRNENDVCIYSNNKITHINEADALILKDWRNSNSRRKWEKAIVIQGSYNGISVQKLAEQVEVSIKTLQHWIVRYQTKGIADFYDKPYTKNPAMIDQVRIKESNLMKLIHETPKLHGINRPAWQIKDLSATYKKVHGENMCVQSVSDYLKKNGYSIKRAKNVLTSPDPKFREKLAHLKNILGNLGTNDRFFSIDEYGPFAVKIKGGRSLVKDNDLKVIPARQKSKGWFICTAALELSTNQITHFYSYTKNTDEMIKLIALLLIQYRTQDKLYLSWDAAIWHQSKKLKAHLEVMNSAEYRAAQHTPVVELTPLPASAQFLNVIESVFSGMSRSIIHNSDYESKHDCQMAIDRYFQERNEHFLLNPKRAGKKIWGKELVKPVFDESHNCKDPRYTW